jgi:hypothetical protein
MWGPSTGKHRPRTQELSAFEKPPFLPELISLPNNMLNVDILLFLDLVALRRPSVGLVLSMVV